MFKKLIRHVRYKDGCDHYDVAHDGIDGCSPDVANGSWDTSVSVVSRVIL